MRFLITCLVLASPGSIEIAESEFVAVKKAKRNLIRIVSIEEKLDFLLENYTEFERELLDLALHQMVYRDLSWTSFRFDFQRVNRRLANLLASARLYTDQVKHDAGSLDDQVQGQLDLAAEFSRQYDARLGFRVMEELRNYTQHRSLPVHRLSYPATWEEDKNLVFRIRPSLSVAELKDDSSVKPRILDELSAVGDLVPLTPLVRDYIEGLGAVHESFRAATGADAASWETVLNEIRDRAAREFGGHKVGLAVVSVDDQGRHTDSEEVFEHLMTYRKQLVRKNGSLNRLSARYVSGSCDLGGD